jgi:hypothetical protein
MIEFTRRAGVLVAIDLDGVLHQTSPTSTATSPVMAYKELSRVRAT